MKYKIKKITIAEKVIKDEIHPIFDTSAAISNCVDRFYSMNVGNGKIIKYHGKGKLPNRVVGITVRYRQILEV